MADYRAYIIGPDGHVQNRVDLAYTDETEAIRLAKLMVTRSSYGNWIVRSKRSSTRPRIWGECGAGMVFHRGGGSGWHDFRCDDGPYFIGFEPLQLAGLDDLDCRFFARSSQVRIVRRNPPLDYAGHAQPSIFGS
ncbi:hypothetical protein KIP88_35495 [Bradyrhizobium sp. SRL28]|uniref:hypothetical protein n=1 Tax=Bradyrhizobium sp. SRL28 TaxID=2836178 RepID=UPI001BDF5B8C|nr:hypothetical protein [Bradyrhizobium sp. SRL28]MBT1515780.1 hypothetical protein [Bradyrhizobium sp. SRL28]